MVTTSLNKVLFSVYIDALLLYKNIKEERILVICNVDENLAFRKIVKNFVFSQKLWIEKKEEEKVIDELQQYTFRSDIFFYHFIFFFFFSFLILS